MPYDCVVKDLENRNKWLDRSLAQLLDAKKVSLLVGKEHYELQKSGMWRLTDAA